MLDHNASVLCCTPTYAIRLAEVAASENLHLKEFAVKKILVAGEPGGSIPAVRHHIESLWPGAKVFDHHGMTEVGPVTYQCPGRPGVLHVMETGYLPEIVDPVSGQPTAPGDSGELVLTTLGRTGSPLLRYRTGDVVKRPQDLKCACGRAEMALEGGILGRTDDMVVVRGVNVYPSAVEEIVRACGGIAEYQVRVSAKQSMAELSMAIEPAEDGQDPGKLASKIQTGLQTTLSLRIPVSVAAPGSLPRFEMKACRWIRED
jgi:phenylacetate-CoA ligase